MEKNFIKVKAQLFDAKRHKIELDGLEANLEGIKQQKMNRIK